MKVLLDTHAFIWAVSQSYRLSEKAKACFLEPQNQLFFSAGSAWEITIKQSLGKLDSSKPITDVIENELQVNYITWLDIRPAHCQRVSRLPFHHRDPFDRLLIAQAQEERLYLLSADEKLDNYQIKRIW